MATLHVNKDVLTVFSDDRISVVNFHNGKLFHLQNLSTPKISSPNDPYMGLTRFCAALSTDGTLYAVAVNRNLIVWSTSDWVQKCTKVLERSASKIAFMPSGEHIVVADKTGDVYLYSMHDDLKVKGTLLLGHVSMLLDICIPLDENYIITCDRDEKIRVSYYPNSYNIQSFCLGHTAFVTRIVLFKFNVLLSSSGDGTLKFWDYPNGKCLATHPVTEDLERKCSDDECIITNLAVCCTEDDIICLSVYRFDGILVYKSNKFELTRIQIISCLEPLDFVVSNKSLWILNPSQRCFSILFWNENDCQFHSETDGQIKSVVDLLCKECSYISKCSYIDISVLHKKLETKEKSIDEACKKIKL